MQITLSWPSPALWDNRRVHWARKAKAKAAARREAFYQVKAAGGRAVSFKRPRLTFEFHPPPRSRPDCQNLPATQKAAIDGIADALGMDDRTFLCRFPEALGERHPIGRVVVTITEGEE